MSITRRISLFSHAALALLMVLFTDAHNGLVNHVLQLVGAHVGEGLAHLVDGLIEQAPLDGVLDEFRECAFFRPRAPR